MAKGKLISKADGTEYEVEFNLTTFANLKKEPVNGAAAAGKHTHQFTVEDDSAIPDCLFLLVRKSSKVRKFNLTGNRAGQLG